MKKILTLLLFAITISNFAQIKGKITDDKGIPLQSVSVFIENTYNGTSSNEQGQYELNVRTLGKQTLIFQYLGFKTQKIVLDITKFPFIYNVQLFEENLSLTEVIIDLKENPANKVIRKAIANKKENAAQTARFKADFYSRGILKLKDAPKKIFGQEIGDMDGALDSTGTGIIYLSETVSKIIFEKPNNLKERIIASKVSGRDNGFSFNTALSTNYDFYDNTIKFNINLISPIADNAFNYYKFKLEGTFNDENNNMINKIKVIAKRDSDPVFEGYIYIVEDSWAIYAVDLDTKGNRLEQEFIEVLNLKQNFSYNKNTKIWAKNAQGLDFTAGGFGIKFNGKFSYVYSNYEFVTAFDKKTFTNEIVSFEDNSNKKDSIFWNQTRPIPLTIEESNDYIKKDSIYNVRNSKKYLDSIDKKNNKFKILKLVTGYTYKNSQKKYSISYNGLVKLPFPSFNTVQGYNFTTGFSFSKWNEEEKGKYTAINTNFNYGLAEERFRIYGNYYHRFNNQNYASLSIAGGTKAAQFNEEEPIIAIVNTISSLWFKNNFMKLYNKEFAEIAYAQNIANGINLRGKLEYQQRKPLFNNTDYFLIKNKDPYTSNNPLLPENFTIPAFQKHHLSKASLSAKINFGNKYISRPDGKINLRNDKYPTLTLNYENAFAGSEKNYEYQLASARVEYSFTAGNKGKFSMNIKGGKFINGENIAFVDYQHFNGNQTHLVFDYMNSFNLLPYYTNSTNNQYSENHFQYDDNGFIINKIPLLNLLKSNLVLEFHSLAVSETKPYTEFTAGLSNLGFGKFKIFRIDYVRSYQNGFQGDGVVFGFKF